MYRELLLRKSQVFLKSANLERALLTVSEALDAVVDLDVS